MPKPQSNESPRRYVSDAWLAEHYDVTRSTIWRWSKKGLLPRPVKLSPGCSRWDLTKIEGQDA